MKAKYLFEIMDLDDERVAVPIDAGAEQFHGVLKLNETGAAILKLLEQNTTEAAIVEGILQEFTGNKEEITSYVHDYIEKLKSEGLVE